MYKYFPHIYFCLVHSLSCSLFDYLFILVVIVIIIIIAPMFHFISKFMKLATFFLC